MYIMNPHTRKIIYKIKAAPPTKAAATKTKGAATLEAAPV